MNKIRELDEKDGKVGHDYIGSIWCSQTGQQARDCKG